MTDIVERLRFGAYLTADELDDMREAAADEIERLREQAARFEFVRDHLAHAVDVKMNGQHFWRIRPLHHAGATFEEAVDYGRAAAAIKQATD